MVIEVEIKDNGISKAAVSVGRIMDRLAPGEYIIKFVKPGYSKDHYWSIDISALNRIDKITIGKSEDVIDK